MMKFMYRSTGTLPEEMQKRAQILRCIPSHKPPPVLSRDTGECIPKSLRWFVGVETPLHPGLPRALNLRRTLESYSSGQKCAKQTGNMLGSKPRSDVSSRSQALKHHPHARPRRDP